MDCKGKLSTSDNRFLGLWECLSGAGLLGAVFEPREDLLVIKLPPESHARLLANAPLRQSLVSQAKALGFSHLVLEL